MLGEALDLPGVQFAQHVSKRVLQRARIGGREQRSGAIAKQRPQLGDASRVDWRVAAQPGDDGAYGRPSFGDLPAVDRHDRAEGAIRWTLRTLAHQLQRARKRGAPAIGGQLP